jgi:hypothetical protein
MVCAQFGVVAVLPEQLCHRVPGGDLDGDEVTVTVRHRTMAPEPDPAGDPPDQAPRGARSPTGMAVGSRSVSSAAIVILVPFGRHQSRPDQCQPSIVLAPGRPPA